MWTLDIIREICASINLPPKSRGPISKYYKNFRDISLTGPLLPRSPSSCSPAISPSFSCRMLSATPKAEYTSARKVASLRNP